MYVTCFEQMILLLLLPLLNSEDVTWPLISFSYILFSNIWFLSSKFPVWLTWFPFICFKFDSNVTGIETLMSPKIAFSVILYSGGV